MPRNVPPAAIAEDYLNLAVASPSLDLLASHRAANLRLTTHARRP
jgi:hypothetical protein